MGKPGVDVTMIHDQEPYVIRITFLINEVCDKSYPLFI